MVRDSVLKTLEVLEKVEWFSSIGQELKLEPSMVGKIERCHSWHEAIEEVKSLNWRNIKNEAMNQISEHLDIHHHDVFQTWNDVNAEIRPKIQEMFASNSVKIPSEKNLEVAKLEVIKALNSDIQRLLIESHWSYLVKPVFFAPMTFWYIKGHFPCGWRGDFPNGKLLVF